MTSAVIDAAGLQQLVSTLIDRGYRVVGPTLSDNAIVLAELTSADDLPQGWGVDVGPGHYRLRRRDDDALFGHSAGPQSWKQFLHPPRQQLWSSDGARTRGAPAVCLPRGAGLRPGRDRDAQRRPGQGRSSRPGIRGTARGASSWSPSTAPNPAACASARPWAPGPRSGPATTWRSPSASTTTAAATSSTSAATTAPTCWRRCRIATPSDAEIDSARADVAEAAHHMGRQMPDG